MVEPYAVNQSESSMENRYFRMSSAKSILIPAKSAEDDPQKFVAALEL
jgi:hypothetical protein